MCRNASWSFSVAAIAAVTHESMPPETSTMEHVIEASQSRNTRKERKQRNQFSRVSRTSRLKILNSSRVRTPNIFVKLKVHPYLQTASRNGLRQQGQFDPMNG